MLLPDSYADRTVGSRGPGLTTHRAAEQAARRPPCDQLEVWMTATVGTLGEHRAGR
jgi:hypothetical protein